MDLNFSYQEEERGQDQSKNFESSKIRKRQTQSCDRCKAKKRRCDGFNPCGNCQKANVECTMNIEQKKRGPKRAHDWNEKSQVSSSNLTVNPSLDTERVEQSSPNKTRPESSFDESLSMNHANKAAIQSMTMLNMAPGYPGSQNVDAQPLANIDTMMDQQQQNMFSLNHDSILDFDLDFAMNFDNYNMSNTDSIKNQINDMNRNKLVRVDLPSNQFPMKPSSFNPPGLVSMNPQQVKNAKNDPIIIDPEVLALYAQLNPKMGVQNDLDMLLSSTLQSQNHYTQNLNNSTDLTSLELIGIPTTFYIHLISMFFTYYHPSFPILDENIFLEKLVPIDYIHPMLLNTVYAIGCLYSRSPYIYQNPFYTPQKAVEYFISKALAATPPPEVWGSITTKSIAICQASLLLSSIDFSTKKSHTWMMVGMSIRLAKKFEMFSDRAKHSFMSIVSGINKFHVDCAPLERKRVWWGALLTDLFLSMSTGSPLIICEADYADSFSFSPSQPQAIIIGGSLLETETNPIVFQGPKRKESEVSDKWMPYFSGFPKDTIFGANDVNSELWGRQSLGFFQVGHLFSNLELMSYVIQLSFFTRRALRISTTSSTLKPNFSRSSFSSFGSALINSLLPTQNSEVQRMHDSLLVFYENLPINLRLWSNLEVFVGENIKDLSIHCTFAENQPLSSVAVLLNLLYFATMSILHESKATLQARYSVSSNSQNPISYNSNDMIRIAYRAQIFILRKIYGESCPPQPTSIPPSAIVGSPILCILLAIPATALLHSSPSKSPLISKLLEPYIPNAFIPIQEQIDATGIDSLESVLLPVLENVGQVWSMGSDLVQSLRSAMAVVKNMQEGSLSTINSLVWSPATRNVSSTASPGLQIDFSALRSASVPSRTMPNTLADHTHIGNAELHSAGLYMGVSGLYMGVSGEQGDVIGDQGTVEKSWHELRDEFEDEFLL